MKWNPFKKEKVEMTPETVQRLLASLGLSLTADGKHVEIRNQSILDNIIPDAWKEEGFLEFWKKYGFNENKNSESDRLLRYTEYDFMRTDSTEVELFVDTVIAESMSYFKDNLCADIKVFYDNKESKDLNEWVVSRIKELKINPMECLDSMIVYGNKFYSITWKDKKITNLDSINDVRDIDIETINNKLKGYKSRNPLYSRRQDGSLYPFEILNFEISHSNKYIKPYGKSYLESLRASFKKLLILESLLALSRSNKVDKLVLYFPSGEETPIDMMRKAQTLRAQLKNLMFGTGSQPKTAPKPPAFIDILLAPQGTGGEGFRYERLPSGVDLSTIEDIEYFWNKFIQGTRMPRAFFRPDEQYQGYMKLSLQDLRFSRFINLVLENYAKTELILAKLLIVSEKSKECPDINKLHLQASVNNVSPVSSEQLELLERSISTLASFIGLLKESSGAEKIDADTLKQACLQILTLPKDVTNKIIDTLFKNLSKEEEEEEIEDTDNMKETLKNILKESSTLNKNIINEDKNIDLIVNEYLQIKEVL